MLVPPNTELTPCQTSTRTHSLTEHSQWEAPPTYCSASSSGAPQTRRCRRQGGSGGTVGNPPSVSAQPHGQHVDGPRGSPASGAGRGGRLLSLQAGRREGWREGGSDGGRKGRREGEH